MYESFRGEYMSYYYVICFILFSVRVYNSRDEVGQSLDCIASMVSLGLFINSVVGG